MESADRIGRSGASLTQAERRVAEVVLERPQLVAFGTVAELAAAVSRQDGARLVKVPGIGKKTAERLLLELKGKLGADLPLPAGATALSDAQADITQALQALGYNEREAQAAIKALPADIGVSDGIKQALKALNR